MSMPRPAEVFPPGEFLLEELDARGWSQADLAEIMDTSLSTVNQIALGNRGITPEIAMALGAALGTSPDVWLGLDQAYQLWKSRDKDTSIVERRSRLFAYAPVRDMISRQWIPNSTSIDVLEASVMQFLGVRQLDELPNLEYAARKSTSYSEPATPAQRAWLCRARQLGACVKTAKFSKDGAQQAVLKLRALLREPEQTRQVSRILADAGISFVVVAPLPGMKIDGACIWLAKDRPLIALSMRFDRIDNFWFNVLHEMDHVIHLVSSVDSESEGNRSSELRPAVEVRADEFATDFLLDQRMFTSFVSRKRPLFSRRAIELFANLALVHPGIVVGQLQKAGEIAWSSHRQLLAHVRDFVTSTAFTDGWGNVVKA